MDDVRDKTFFAHVMSENCVIVSKSAVFTHVGSRPDPFSLHYPGSLAAWGMSLNRDVQQVRE